MKNIFFIPLQGGMILHIIYNTHYFFLCFFQAFLSVLYKT